MATSKSKPVALSLHIGLNGVNGPSYGGWSGPLSACEFDANDMAAVAKANGMTPTVLLTKKGTRANVLMGIQSAAKALKAGDLFFLTYSGHGGQVPDTNGDEPDKQDETWCLYDGQLIDDELYLELSRFAAGVRILVLSDSCHSGSVVRDAPPPFDPTLHQRPKMMPPAVAMRTYRENKAFYDKLQRDVAKEAKAAKTVKTPTANPDAVLAHLSPNSPVASLVSQIKAAVILISGCQDNQTSMDGAHNGAFTEQVLKVWNNGRFVDNYANFHIKVRARMPATQSPNLFTLGVASGFLAQTPFKI